MFGAYIAASVILIFFAVLMLVIIPNVFAGNRASAVVGGTVIFLLIACMVIGFVFVVNKIYWGNSWVVSSDSLTQISQRSLFNKQSSQLSLSNLENVTSEQHGILPQLFKYGTLRVETAGERTKFTFPYCPNPYYYAQKILAAREAFEQAHFGGKQQSSNAAGQTHRPQPR